MSHLLRQGGTDRVKRISDDREEYIMRGTYEAFILVKVKDGKKYVCALNRQKSEKGNPGRTDRRQTADLHEDQVIWN